MSPLIRPAGHLLPASGAKETSGKRQASSAVECGARQSGVSLLPAGGEKVAAAG
ncbi:hypothetical protein SM0020_19707 [Sinorhizobium meliloti CCNWSX0020]|uniref:Uncharacterized protein n=1 Tax=Sinorhizobium meliloti CCNWSX0020 TaxID=1107881 RepID=H0G395_RHIML|nr:hypothetical protein [Sinorhizobium meliloti]EHK76258.1 hypothetical protein SM0020_19707 [Sinorhizobium meliloti CCNWSX0020]PII38328.1 hypothetical protein T190_22440 [Sinorhizobium meliloti CCBAU 01290]